MGGAEVAWVLGSARYPRRGAGMTDLFAWVWRSEGVGVVGEAVAGVVDGWCGSGLGAVLGEIPAAGRGYDGSFCAGMAEWSAGMAE